ncbi:hypothetical protein CH363_01440 [Leptospira haakeii]|uniref:Uncharacterized protein n=1 Tax=Leptospira haakeii TaxID=2023198 RepID=A0ABX4PSF3_9LEPT|nr:hypothetical protein CH363_01440 [Leptospira haakeii]PKA21062.1 hypothetical protein CH377_01440 [Leptospira haakeii]
MENPCSTAFPLTVPGNHYSANRSVEMANSTLQAFSPTPFSEKKHMITLGYSNEKREKKRNQSSA